MPPRQRLSSLFVTLLAIAVGDPPGHAFAQEDPGIRLVRADSLYFAGNAEASIDLLATEGPWGPDSAQRRWRTMRATELWPFMVLYHVDLAKLLIKRKREDEARDALERALATSRLHPPDASLKEEARALLECLKSEGKCL